MLVRYGDKIKCYTTGTMADTGNVFCIKNKEYKIIQVKMPKSSLEKFDRISLKIIDEQGKGHSFNASLIAEGLSKWFTLKGILIEKSISNESLNNIKYRYKDSYFLI